MKKQAVNKYLAALLLVLMFASGLGIGYIWASNKIISIHSAILCKFSGLGT